VTLGIISPLTSPLRPVGALTPVAATPQISAGSAGLMMTVPGLVAAISAPSTIVAAGRRDRHLALYVLIAPMSLANLASVIAPSIAGVLAFLLVTGHFMAYTFVRPILQDLGGFPGLRPCRAHPAARPGR
jgi:predicted MFS family arabinose efflux permease